MNTKYLKALSRARNEIGYYLVITGDWNDDDLQTEIYFFPMEDEKFANYLFSRCLSLKNRRLDEEMEEDELDLFNNFLPSDQYGSIRTITDIGMVQLTQDGEAIDIKPADTEMEFDEAFEKYLHKGCDFKWNIFDYEEEDDDDDDMELDEEFWDFIEYALSGRIKT